MAVGTQIGTYRIESQLGHGGFGVVYVGVDVRLGRRAAIKQLLPELSGNREIVERFFNEAKAAANINHPGIVEIYDVGWHTDGSAYFAMKLLEGDSLAKRLRNVGPMPQQLACTIARQVSSALVAAHTRGIVHRDLKPDNIILVADDEVAIGERAMVLDFGIAKLFGDKPMSQKTRTGMMMGTPAYMSPEQCRGAGEVDHRTDVYALGCILFEMLAGRAPFVAEGAGEILGMHQFVEPPPLRSLRPDITPELEAVVMRTLAKKPDQRQPQQMAELQVALQPFATGGRHSAERSAHMPAVSSAMPIAATVAPTHAQLPTPPNLLHAAQHVTTDLGGSPSRPSTTPPVTPTLPVQPSHTPEPSRPAQPSTFSAARGEVAVAPAKRKSKLPLLIGGGVLAAGAVIAIVLATSKSTPAKSVDAAVAQQPRDAALVVELDAAIVVVATPDAAPVVEPADRAKQIALDCAQMQADKKWADLETCGQALAKVDAAKGKAFTDSANAEIRAEAAFRKLQDAVAARDSKTAKTQLDRIPADSVYRKDAETAHRKLEQELVATLVVDLKKLASTKDCVGFDRRLKQAESLGRAALDQARSQVRCADDRSAGDDLAKQAQQGFNAGDYATAFRFAEQALAKKPGDAQLLTLATISACRLDRMDTAKRYLAKMSASRQTMARQVCSKLDDEAKPPSTPPPACDSVFFDAELARGDTALQNGSFAQALAAFESALKCKRDPRVFTRAYLAACRARNPTKAKIYFKLLAQPSLAQICLKEGIDPSE